MLAGFTLAANMQDSDGTNVLLFWRTQPSPKIVHIFAQGVYSHEKLEEALTEVGGPRFTIVKRRDETNILISSRDDWSSNEN